MEKNDFFNSYKLPDNITKSLEALGYRTPTRIQQSVIPPMLSGNNVLTKAPMGSEKAATFGVPICEYTAWGEGLPQVLILEPTRELAERVRDELLSIGRLKRLKAAAVYGGFPIDKQIRTLKQKSHMIMGIPGRLVDHIHRETLKSNKVSRVVIDGTDLVLNTGSADEVKEILSKLPQDAGISLFPATLKPEVCQLTDDFAQDAVTITCDAQPEEGAVIRQLSYEVASENKCDTFIKVLRLENPDNAVIFCGIGEMVNVLFQKLRRNRIFCGMLHGEMEQKERLKAVNTFRRDRLRFLIATDVAARGIDFKDITHTINYDFSTGKETYVHRIGHTGRNGKAETAVNLVYEDDRWMLKMVEEHMGRTFYVEKASVLKHDREKAFRESQRVKAKLKDRDGNGSNKDITRLAIGGRRRSKIRANDIVATIRTIDGVDMTDMGIIDIGDSSSYMEILN